ncbi:nicotinate-nucleotide adenylyltransferase [Anaeropeptidivorans aminofermentans]|uniref:nicotinate-nucleotide adenylyltransferase n=1 Tax=Anaeropeptidivorans aminofermentans TaxID=2934315 RepID=UPI00202532C4|nr:nicotinate-nucleotide adenylyltransferase [Anaeropeptidivorans aminofermentans]
MKSELNDFKYLKSIAIMGGTFDPIHYGHLTIAEAVRQEYDVEKVIFIPTGTPPHKNALGISEKKHRYLMTVLATLSNESFEVSSIELDNEDCSYSVDTITEIKNKCYENTPIYFIIGADAIFNIFSWKEPERLLLLCEFVVVARPNYDTEKLKSFIDKLNTDYDARVSYLEIPLNHISSSDIRNRVKNKKSIKYLVPENVEDYIYKYSLYSEPLQISAIDFSLVNSYLKDNLSKSRYNHTIGVSQMALILAKNYGVDEDKAYTAGLLHDIAKEIPLDEKIRLCKEFGIEIDKVMKNQPELLHSFISAALATSLFGIQDEDILNAIKYHTTGRARMSNLEKIIFLADVAEPNRKAENGLTEIRDASLKDLNYSLVLALRRKIKYTMKKNEELHPLSTEALNYYEKCLLRNNNYSI